MSPMTLDDARRLGGLDHATTHHSKYHNVPCEVDGIKFDSKAEAARYGYHALRQRAGEISDLQVHPRYVIVDKDAHGRAMYYEADFSYSENGDFVVEDVKGGKATQTPLWRLKARLLQARYPMIVFRVVER